ncbi:MAG: hypothetical protein EU547_07785 [Promethearchaeota archaeon]|nr:MAG: hypothetical protein EU547_07785 [Candidatus Lokiarchaeota archaeon]
MKMYIFQKNGPGDFDRIPIEVEVIKPKSLVIIHEEKLVELRWKGEFTYQELCYGDIINIYIFKHDFENSYVMPYISNATLANLSEDQIFRSELDKLRAKYKKEDLIRTQIIKSLIEFFSKRSIENLGFIQHLTSHPENLMELLPQLKELLQKHQNLNYQKKSEIKEGE